MFTAFAIASCCAVAEVMSLHFKQADSTLDLPLSTLFFNLTVTLMALVDTTSWQDCFFSVKYAELSGKIKNGNAS